MDNFFLAHAMINIDGLQQTQRECQNLLYPSFSSNFSTNCIQKNGVFTRKKQAIRPNGHFSYNPSDFTPPVFDEWVKLEGMTGEEKGYVRCRAEEKNVEIQVKITEEKDKDVVLQCVKSNILSALFHGYTNIKASVGEGDKWAKEILEELGFQKNPGVNDNVEF